MADILTPDICVVGAGSAGLTVAAAASAFGTKVVLVERARMGGDCLNVGCVPSKALLAAAKHAEAIRTAPRFGVHAAGEPKIDFSAVKAHVDAVIAGIAPKDSVERFEKLGVTVLTAHAQFVDRQTLSADGRLIRARRFVVAAGSSPFVPAIEGIDTIPYLTNETLFDLTECPEHLLVVGGGPIGMEMAQAHRRLGARVTVFAGGGVLPGDDRELASVVSEQLRREGVSVHEGTRIVGAKATPDGIALKGEDADGSTRTFTGSHVLIAAGRSPNVAGLGLEAAGVDYRPSGIAVGTDLRTSNRRIYAVGDITGRPYFTHLAGHDAGLVLRALLFRLPVRARRETIPHVTFTDPELGQVGMTESQAGAKGVAVDVLTWPYEDNDRAHAERQRAGLVKLVVDKRGKILGAGVAGAAAGEMTNLFSLALSKGLKISDLRDFVSPYPTFSEIGKRAATAYYADYTKRPLVRRVVSLLRRFG